jgi:uncharacterized membrane protein
MNTPRRLPGRNGIFVLFLALCCGVLIVIPTGFEDAAPDSSHRARARIVAVDNRNVQQNLLVKTGEQQLTVEILDGPHAGTQAVALNALTGKMELDEVYDSGRIILLEYSMAADGTVRIAYSRGTYRIGLELLLIGLFAALLLAVAGWVGFKAILSFLFAGLMIWKVMVPCFLKGYDPILIALGVVLALTASIAFLIGGLSRKGLTTFVGAFLGLGLTCLLAQLFVKGFRVHGAVRPFAETLLYSGFYHLDLTRIFIAGVFTASSGAVMDLAMDISASMDEIIRRNPRLSVREHMASGMAVGRAVIGTMTTTLLLAYSGSFIAMLMFFMGQGIPLVNIFNKNHVAAEVLNTCVGSFGLVTVAPFTAMVGGLLYRLGRPTATPAPATG